MSELAVQVATLALQADLRGQTVETSNAALLAGVAGSGVGVFGTGVHALVFVEVVGTCVVLLAEGADQNIVRLTA